MLIKAFYHLIALLPNIIAQCLGIVSGHLLSYFPNRESRVARVNIDLCFPKFSQKERDQLVKDTLVENAKTLFEMPKIFRKGGKYALGLVSEVEGLEVYQAALKRQKGIILLAPHLGNWELIVHYLNQFSPMVAMFAPPKQIFLNDIMRKARQSTGAILVPADPSGVRAQLKHLKQGGVVGILPDQLPKSGHAGVFAPFMGHSAYTMLLVNRLVKRVDATIVYAFAERLGLGKGYKIHILSAPDGISSDDEVESATQLNRGVEMCVNIAPSQYQWTYKRFRKQPSGIDYYC
ncbi:MAG: lipid A biosynthesis acyltransferase [Gammaproteobacteria bacterium]|nr:MAG: lipid A biosynthesis acyltransferase [Gammaproteobacteria bacterium]